MTRSYMLLAGLIVLALAVPAPAADVPKDAPATWLSLADAPDASAKTEAASSSSTSANETLMDCLSGGGFRMVDMWRAGTLTMADIKNARARAPLPVHTIEGVGGTGFVPVAFLVNPGPEGTVVGMPAVSFSYVHMKHKKSIQSFAVTQTFFRRFELGYALIRMDLGTLPNAISNTLGQHISRDSIYLHNFNFRALLVEEDSFNLPLPALTAGVHFKYNCSIRAIDNRVFGGVLGSVGFDKSNGVDYTLTASKTLYFPPVPPLVVTFGLRNTKASHIGFGGFGNTCRTNIEFSVAALLTEWLTLSYEFRRKITAVGPNLNNQGLLGRESNWHAIGIGVVVTDNLTIGTAVSWLGNLGNTNGDGSWGLQVKYEF